MKTETALKSRRASLLCLIVLSLLPLGLLAQSAPAPRPSPGLMPNPGAGKPLYEKSCASCHGLDLRGTAVGPALLHKVYEPAHHSDVSFQMAVRSGSRAHHWKFGDMLAVPGLTPDQVAHITAYVRAGQRRVGIQ